MPTRKHNFSPAEILAGFVVLAGIAAALLFFAAVSGMRPPAKVKTFHASFPDTFGLNKGADVRFGGYKIGRVSNIGLDPENQNLIRVEAQVPPDLPVNAESRAYITAVSLTSELHLEITTGAADAPLLASGAALRTREGGLFQQAENVAAQLGDVLESVRGLVGAETSAAPAGSGEAQASAGTEGFAEPVTVATVLKNLDSTIRTSERLMVDADGVLLESRDDVAAILAKIQTITDRAQGVADEVNALVAENRPAIRAATDTAAKTMARVDAATQRVDAIAASLETVLANSEALTGDAKALVAENRPTLEEMVREMRETVRYLKLFSRVIADDPSVLVRGSSASGKK